MINVMARPWHGKSSRPWQSSPVNSRFVFEAKTTGLAETFALPLEAGGTYDFYIDWGDGNSDSITVWNDAAVTHTYASAGTYLVAISGIIQGWRFNNGGDKLKIYDIKSWGPLKVGNSKKYFYGCSNLTASATDILDTSGMTDFEEFFRGCSSITALDVGSWDTSSITNFISAFRSCSSLVTLNIGLWDVGSVTSFYAIFHGCSSLTALNVSLWNTSNVIDFQHSFSGCSSLTTLNVSLWDVGSATSLHGIFYNCSSLTALNLGLWDTSNVTNLKQAFQDCSSLTTLALDNWDITAVTTMEDMLKNVTLITNNYSLILVAFEAQAVQNNVLFHAGNSQYYGLGFAATARAALIADHSWTITDGGIE